MLKNKNTGWLVLFLFLCCCEVRAERTAGFCGLREEANGKEVLELFAGVNFSPLPNSDRIYRVWIDLWVPTRLLYDGIRFQVKTKLYDQNRKPAAKVMVDFNPLRILEESDSLTHVVVAGFIERACAHPDFIPEVELSKLMENAGDNERFESFQPFLEKFGFRERKETPAYTSYLITQPNFTRQKLEPRLLLVFYKHELIAIFHTGIVRVKRYDSIEMGKQYKMIYNSRFSDHNKREMVEIYKRQLD